MKILHEGTKPVETVWWLGRTGTCETCKTKVELEMKDHHHLRLVYRQQAVSIQCPVCSKDIVIFKSNLLRGFADVGGSP